MSDKHNLEFERSIERLLSDFGEMVSLLQRGVLLSRDQTPNLLSKAKESEARLRMLHYDVMAADPRPILPSSLLSAFVDTTQIVRGATTNVSKALTAISAVDALIALTQDTLAGDPTTKP